MKAHIAKRLIDQVGPHIDSRYDLTCTPIFPEERRDVCVVRRRAKDVDFNGYDTLYLVWESDGQIRHDKIDDSSQTMNPLYIGTIREVGKNIIVEYWGEGHCEYFNEVFRISKKKLGIA